MGTQFAIISSITAKLQITAPDPFGKFVGVIDVFFGFFSAWKSAKMCRGAWLPCFCVSLIPRLTDARIYHFRHRRQ